MKSFVRLAVVVSVSIIALICVINIKNNKSDAYVVESIIPCTEKSIRHIIFIPQIHSADFLTLNNPLNGESQIKLVSKRQKQIYFTLIDLDVKTVFSEGYTSKSAENDSIDMIRIAHINRGVFLLGNATGVFKDVDLVLLRDEIMNEQFICNRLEFLYQLERKNSDEAELVSYYKRNLKIGPIVSSEVAMAISKMDEDRLFLDELDELRKNIDAKVETFNAMLKEIKRERDANNQRLLRKYPYFAGGALKLASEGKIKILPGENSKLNSRASALLGDYKRREQELKLKLLELKVSKETYALFFQEKSDQDLAIKAKEVGVLSEYLKFATAKKAFDEIQEKRDDFLVESVAQYSGSEFDVAVVFGTAHEFSDNVQNYNKRHPERQICLSRIKWNR